MHPAALHWAKLHVPELPHRVLDIGGADINLVGVIAWIMIWAVRAGQFEDLEGPGQSIIMDDDTPKPGQAPTKKED